jgi:hypothetical protein
MPQAGGQGSCGTSQILKKTLPLAAVKGAELPLILGHVFVDAGVFKPPQEFGVDRIVLGKTQNDLRGVFVYYRRDLGIFNLYRLGVKNKTDVFLPAPSTMAAS